MNLAKTIIRFITRPNLPKEWIQQIAEEAFDADITVPEKPSSQGTEYVVYELEATPKERNGQDH